MWKGQTFLGTEVKTPRGCFRHLNIVISDVDTEHNYLVVPITTYRIIDGRPLKGQDKSCILSGGCHPFIVHDSYACYGRARKMSYTEIYNGIKKGLFAEKAEIDGVCLKKLQNGARVSPYLPEELTSFFEYF